jgi:hypothetical protein
MGVKAMKAITVKQPWAWLICNGIKDIENRSWPLPAKYLGKRILIHAGAKPWTENFYKVCTKAHVDEILNKTNLHYFYDGAKVTSAIIGSVKIVDCVQNHPSIWAIDGQYHWVLAKPVLFDKPIPAKGRLGFWEYVQQCKPV